MKSLLIELREYLERLKHRADVRGGPDVSAMHIADEAIAKVDAAISTLLEAPPITDNDKRWRLLEHGCQWVSWTPTGGETHSFDPRDVEHLKRMRAWADETIEKQLAALRDGIAQASRSPRAGRS